jgi:hypothetical protein
VARRKTPGALRLIDGAALQIGIGRKMRQFAIVFIAGQPALAGAGGRFGLKNALRASVQPPHRAGGTTTGWAGCS